ncbi:MAG: BrnT family toxin [Bacteriovoracaceae bacterium]|nr:BrnT family toxin [Bacteriovoracaceae bacterium]
MYIHKDIIRFDWDTVKNNSNFEKHGIWLEEAKTVWTDPHSIELYDVEHSHEEKRFLRIRYSISQRLLLVVFCERMDGTIIRIISSRKATSKEKILYEEGI